MVPNLTIEGAAPSEPSRGQRLSIVTTGVQMISSLPIAARVSSSVSAIALGQGSQNRTLDCVEEEAVAFRYNGFPHGVMMATPTDLEDFAAGFSLAEGVVDSIVGIEGMAITPGADGIEIDVSLSGESLHRYLADRRIRQLRGNTSCGLCGVRDLADVQRAARQVRSGDMPDEGAIITA